MTKQDTNYIAGLEKAVAKKYGKETVQDFRSQWSEEKEKEYLSSLKAANKKKTSKTSKDNNNTKPDRTCPVCKTYSFSSKDDLYMVRYSCCFHCYLEHVVGREDRWKEGYRPTDNDIEHYLRRRKDV